MNLKFDISISAWIDIVINIGNTDWRPIKLKVSNAIRMDSDEPLTDGDPAHDAA